MKELKIRLSLEEVEEFLKTKYPKEMEVFELHGFESVLDADQTDELVCDLMEKVPE